MGSTKNIAQMGDAWSLRFSARIQRFSMVLYLLVLYLCLLYTSGFQHRRKIPEPIDQVVGDTVGVLLGVGQVKHIFCLLYTSSKQILILTWR